MDFLKAILGDDLYSQVVEKINAHNGDEANKEKQIKLGNLAGGEYISKAKHDAAQAALQAMLDGKITELDTANGLITDLKKGTKGNEELQGKVTAYETKVQQLQEQLKQTQLDAEIKIALLSAKAEDVEYMTFKLKEQGDLELDADGHIKAIDDKIAGLKTQFPAQFAKAGANHVQANPLPPRETQTAGITKEQFDKMGYQNRLKLKQEQPEVYAQMTGKVTE